MVCSYLDHAAVYGQGGANHVDVRRGRGALPLGQPPACRCTGRGVVEGMRGGISMGRAVRGCKRIRCYDSAAIVCAILRHCLMMTNCADI